jgi:hypothetical protein
MADVSKMKISELIAFAEAQAQREQEHPPVIEVDHDTSWAATLAVLRYMKQHGVPEPLQD